MQPKLHVLHSSSNKLLYIIRSGLPYSLEETDNQTVSGLLVGTDSNSGSGLLVGTDSNSGSGLTVCNRGDVDRS